MKGILRRTQIPNVSNKLIGCQRLTSTHKGCNRQSVMSRPQYEQKCLIDHNSASDKLSEENKETYVTICWFHIIK